MGGSGRVVCGAYLGDTDGTCPKITCVRRRGHEGPHDNLRGDDGCGYVLRTGQRCEKKYGHDGAHVAEWRGGSSA